MRRLAFGPEHIRCTSVDGYKLKAGGKTDPTLRQEVCEAETLVGLITGASVGSTYVLFELGARWGTDKDLVPLLGGGADASYLRGPLSGYNALTCDSAADLLQLIEDLAKHLGVTPCSAASYQTHVQDVITASRETPRDEPASSSESTKIPIAAAELNLSSQALNILRQVVSSNAEYVMLVRRDGNQIVFNGAQPKVSEPQFVEDDFESLCSAGLLKRETSPNGHPVYRRNRKGVEFVKAVIASDPSRHLSDQAKDILRQLVRSNQRRVITLKDGSGGLLYSLIQDPQLVFMDDDSVDFDFQSLVDAELMRLDYGNGGNPIFNLTSKGAELGKSLQ